MKLEFTKYAAEVISSYIEIFAISLIALIIIIIIINNVVHLFKRNDKVFNIWRTRSWRGIQGGLDLLVAADLISTIAIDRELESVVTLGLLLVIRTFISWSLEIEMEGCWPWQKKVLEKSGET